VELEGIGHSPQLDIPLETAQLIVGFGARPSSGWKGNLDITYR